MDKETDSITLDTLRWTPLLSVLTDDLFQQFIAKAQPVEYGLGDSIDCGTDEQPALCVLLIGSVRVADQAHSGDHTLYMMTERGSFFSSELTRRAHIPSVVVRASGNATILRLDGAPLAELLARSEPLTERLNQESRILHSFMRLRSTQRFRNLAYWPFRPLLSQCFFRQFSQGETFTTNDKSKEEQSADKDFSSGLFIVVDGCIACERSAQPDVLKPGDWFSRGSILPGREGDIANTHATTGGELLYLPQDAYIKVKELNPELVSQMNLLLLGSNDAAAASDISNASQVLGHLETPVPIPSAPPMSVPIEEEPVEPRLRRQFKKYPMVYQHSELECGITCLHMICLFYGKKISLVQLRELCEIGRSGSSMLQLAEAAEQLGFVSRGVRSTASGLSKLRLPVILYWRRNHFVVLYEIHPQYALIGDPAEGLNKVDIAKFRQDFSEHALELAPTEQWFGQVIKSKSLWHTFSPVLKPHMNLIKDVLICSIFFQLLQLATPIFTQVVIDQVVVHQDLDTLNILLAGMLLMTVFQASMGYLRQFFLAFLSLKADQTLFTELLKRLLSLPLSYFTKHATGDTLTRFGESSGVVQFLTGMGAMSVLDVLMAAVFLGVVYIYNVLFGLVATGFVVFLVVFMFCCAPILKKLSQRAYDKQMAAESFLVEAVQGIEKIKSAAAERRSRWKWESLFLEKLNVRFQEVVATSLVSTVTRLLQVSSQIAFLWLGAHMIISKELTIGQLMAMTMLMSMILQPFMRLADLAQMFQTVNVAVERLGEVLLEKPEETDPTAKIRLANLNGHVKFDKVSFRYPGGEAANALTNISFEARPGQMIGIVGRSGSGKTTLTKLIQGLYQPTDGRIYIDGHDLAQVSLSSYRRKIGVVSQNEYYFRGTVRENIAFYKPDAKLEEIVNACTISGINDLLRALPSGYESVLSEGAANFSGGQRQCMAIARAILHEPTVLIFDEATSAMDSETERLIQDCMERLRAKSTMFVVAHRLSTIMSADLILVIDQGQLAESGTHDTLMQEKGIYFHLCKKQALNV
ncbi:MAG TPA: peptidase domain-containing ABC transporter [Trichormus sp.]